MGGGGGKDGELDFNVIKINVLTLCIRKDRPEQTGKIQTAASDQGLHCLQLIQNGLAEEKYTVKGNGCK